jgi:hypothetical protein
MSKNIDEMFENYDKIKLAKKTADDEKADKERVKREAAVVLMTSVVLPTLKQFIAQVKSKGHKAMLNERIENYSYPHLEMDFTPVPKVEQTDSYVSASKLTFIHSEGGALKVRKEINPSSHSGYSHDSGGEYTVKPEQVTAEWVKNEVLIFIESVLNAN